MLKQVYALSTIFCAYSKDVHGCNVKYLLFEQNLIRRSDFKFCKWCALSNFASIFHPNFMRYGKEQKPYHDRAARSVYSLLRGGNFDVMHIVRLVQR